MGAPPAPQNLTATAFAAPHAAQTRARATPHSPQYLRSGALVPPQLEQTTRASYQSPIVWNGTYRRGRRDARRSGHPIESMAAAPVRCPRNAHAAAAGGRLHLL